MSDETDGRDAATGQFLPGNTVNLGKRNNEIHGGAAAQKALAAGAPFTGLAAQEEQQVRGDLEEQGRAPLVEELAVRLHTVARLYYGACLAAADAGDLQALHGHVSKFGWLAGAALRAWEQHRKEEASQPPALDYDTLIEGLKREQS